MLRSFRLLLFLSAVGLFSLLLNPASSPQVSAAPSSAFPPASFVEQQRFTANDASPSDSFGSNIVKDGNTLLISGGYIFVNNGSAWTQQTKFTASTGSITRFLNSTIALNGDTALVGVAPEYDLGLKGAVLVFVRNGTTWTLQATLNPSDGVPRQDFGIPFFVDSNTVLVGAPSGDANYLGSVYIFVRSGTTWTEVGKFSASDGSILDTFGSSFASDGDTVMIGARYSPQPNYGAGAVYVFNRSGTTFTEQAKLTVSGTNANLGHSIALKGDTALIGAIQDDGLRGSAYVFTRSGTTWTQQAKLVPSDIVSPSGSVYFGTSVSLDGDTAAIGAPFAFDNGSRRGAVYFFTRSSGQWAEQAKLIPNDNRSEFAFGSGVILEGDRLLVSAPSYFGNRPGEVFAYLRGSVPLGVELLVNAGFDDGQVNGVPFLWQRKNTTKDERRCNKANETPIAYSGGCAYFMKGDSPIADKIKLAQNVNLSAFNLKAGDHIRLTGFYNKQSTGSVYVYLFVSYANLPQDQRRIILTRTTNGYQPVNPSSVKLKAVPTRIRVELENRTTSGKTWFDEMSLELGETRQSTLLPLPLGEEPQTESLIPLP